MNLIETKLPKNKTSLNKRTIFYTIYLFLVSVLFICALSTRTYISQNGSYHDKNHVALYLYTYKQLPSNYITKQKSEDSGKQPSDGKYIGGNMYWYSGKIKDYTTNQNLREADIDYPTNTRERGTKRLVYTVDCTEIYYTNDHYQTFTFITRWSINAASNVFWIFFGTIITIGIGYSIYLVAKGKEKRTVYINEIATASKNYLKIIGYVIITPFVLIYMLIDWVVKKARKQ